MANEVRVLGISGSLRKGSYNTLLVKSALAGAAGAGAKTTFLDLRELSLPVFDEDLEASGPMPEGVRRLKDELRAHQGLVIASPEYNSSVTAALKNTIDWATRPEPGQPPLSCFNGKVAGLVAASPGGLGGLRGLVHLRAILGNINVIVLPQQVAVPRAHEAFGEGGVLKDPAQRASVEAIGAAVCNTARKLQA
ncbi:MAG: NAD(P)H-dependent oxidoreductase [Phycisphaerales bacterium]|nr:NAD(P)H-dependent oxidoreductase [Phycisphaerales bacterium]